MNTSGYIWTFTVCGIYQVTHLLGGGASGHVARAFNMLTGTEVAIKMELLHVDADNDHPPTLAYEAAVYEVLGDVPQGFLTVRWAGRDCNHYVIIMDKLGPNLGSLRRFCRGSFTLRTICRLADQMLDRIEFVHSRGLIMGDIKPHNFAMGVGGNAHIVHLFDFGHAKLYLDSDGSHVPFRENCSAIGTPAYASVAAHLSHELCRRDDIESLFYVLLEFYFGKLPWDDIYAPTYRAKIQRMGEMKAKAPLYEFVQSQAPPELRAYYAHYTSLSFTQAPDYAFLRSLFTDRMSSEGWVYDGIYDWIDPSGLEKGTLIPEEYVIASWFAEDVTVEPY